MNTIKFKAHEYHGENRGMYLEIFIDGQPLSQIIEQYLGTERGLGPIRYPRKVKYYLLGYKDFHDEQRGKKYILECSCGNSGCDEIFCKITVDEERVTWSDFYGSFINLSDFEGFVFDEHQYHQEIASLPEHP